ncbi:50S ribosomal protein L22 [Candidatus Saccharibacteria bacterium]|nr:50S ribosomal protein L22 [Candidatus Saccharibacteria bacterium]MCB9821552.1 50S ribosomal protein L22 [Candidatus Nomurabacteria bacterium]
MSVKAIAKNVRMSPRKVNEVAALVRGRTVAEALVILDHVPRRAAQPVRKTVASAKANAIKNHNFKEDGLYIEQIFVNAGARFKRYRPAAHGRALPFIRRSSNVYVIVNGEQRPAKKPATTKKEAK